uniref:LIM zinc-binding domain-containing protein n=1 Tax=Romanomermis culicivorax TaxID=13658 RepID=A0A915ILL0_ROMCU
MFCLRSARNPLLIDGSRQSLKSCVTIFDGATTVQRLGLASMIFTSLPAFKDSTKVKSPSVLSASPYRKQQGSVIGSSTSGSNSPAPPSRKISSASLYETPPLSRRAIDCSLSLSSHNMSPVEKAEMMENRRKLSAADRRIESVEKLANQILEDKIINAGLIPVLSDKNDAKNAKAFEGGVESYSKANLRPPSPKFPTNDSEEASSTKDRSKKDNDKRICSKCSTKIGNGAAMAIDSLDMIFHLSCFACDSCDVRLGDGACGTDVRVVDKRLMCQICYENEIM